MEQTKGGLQQQIEDGKAQLAIALKQIELQEQGRSADAKLAFEREKFAAELELKREDQAIRREELAYNLSVQQEKSANDNAVKMRGHDVADNANALKANVELMKASDDHLRSHLPSIDCFHPEAFVPAMGLLFFCRSDVGTTCFAAPSLIFAPLP